MRLKAEDKVVDVEGSSGGAFSQEDMVKMLQNMGNAQIDNMIERSETPDAADEGSVKSVDNTKKEEE